MTDETPALQPARLVLTRNKDEDVKQRQIFASLDGVSMGDMIFGESLSRQIAPGPHTLRVHNTLFWKTLEFEAAPGEEVRYSTVNYSGRGYRLLALIIGVAPLFLRVEREGVGAVPEAP